MRLEGHHHARTAKPGGLGIDGRNQRAVAEMDAVEIADGGDRTMHGRRETRGGRSEEHTSELQSLMRISYAVFCLKKTQYTSDKYTTTTPLQQQKDDEPNYKI